MERRQQRDAELENMMEDRQTADRESTSCVCVRRGPSGEGGSGLQSRDQQATNPDRLADYQGAF